MKTYRWTGTVNMATDTSMMIGRRQDSSVTVWS